MFDSLISNLPWPDKPATRSAIGPLYGAAETLCVAELAERGRPLLVVTPNTSSALNLERELALFASADTPVLALPDWETLPYDHFSPHPDIVSERLSAFYRLPKLDRGVVIVPITTLMQRTPPTWYVNGNTLNLRPGEAFDLNQVVRDLQRTGYRAVETVFEHGEYAVRGALLDIFPMGSELPYRIDLFDDEIESLRTFDPESQRTVERMDSIRLLPAREFPLTEEAIHRFQMNWFRQFEGDAEQCPTFTELCNGRVPGGAEYYLPLFFEETGTVLDFLPANTAVITVGNHHGAAERFWEEITHRHSEYGIDPRRPLLPPSRVFTPVEDLYASLKQYAVLELRNDAQAPVHARTELDKPPEFSGDNSSGNAIDRLREFIQTHKAPVLLCAESAGRKEVLLENLIKHGVSPESADNWHDFIERDLPLAITVSPVDRGIYAGPGKPTLVAESQLFGQRVAQRRRRGKTEETDAQAVIRDLTELSPGVPVVHLEHGVGRYIGLQTLEIENDPAEFLVLEYASDDKLYVPVGSLHLISRYTGSDPDSAPLHRLGSEQWEKARRKASKRASDVAAQLLEVYARREARQGFAHAWEPDAWDRFCNQFPFEETPDQAAAIEAVRNDMCAPGVMDRLVCGDVGFGKTEVAMRAAFLAARNGKQVAVLVPTTLLAQQHFNSFRDRFAGWSVTVEVISRFKTAKDIAAVAKRVESGDVDILVGTHKLLQTDFRFNDLGLLIIDEEHRFGVKQKESIKALRAEIDILTMTATPIPRTLNMALGGLRDLSIIATPPARRLSIKTFIREHNTALVKEAVLRETLRGGQVYYLHNEVKTIAQTAQKLQTLLPDLSVGIAHGQMREVELERVMSDFYHQRHHVLVCSTIIETGIDIPNANTIIIERADKFGLAQLHQLRGRVGRSHHQAYAYLLSPPRSSLTRDAEKRLEAIEAAGALGAGYMLATHDLEIRGAGELLGDEQSGQIHSVGFSLYLDMLHNAVAALKRGEIPDVDAPLDKGTEVKLHVPALIPENYLPDITMRLVLYKRIAAARTHEDLRNIQVEMIDRFGLLPDVIKNLFVQAAIRVRAKRLGINEIEVTASGGSIEFSDATRVNPMSLVKLVQSDPHGYTLSGANRLRFKRDLPELEDRRDHVEILLDTFSDEAASGKAA
ncbi:transcription-repair coupling factor [Luminiphilus syltensis NOR5-1B]|uniref:Transcription-repair-coupling factor n=1 Tax=Luminiphilus syltensis NOR5-1B TaxID=565045 RepID=B8KYH9_9GAMM|nr:transcription-repair coupling factor [Luminiphilus syltensis]EED34215.1 transcription-repair coupling factor [Luminiphilus syltensis NOR5-1B]